MRTMRLPDMVKKVSSLVKNQSTKTFQKDNQLTISTEIWDFNFTKLDDLGYYVYDNEELKKTILREVICKYGLITGL